MSQLPDNYIGILSKLKERIRTTRMKVVLAANAELLAVYWEIGQTILDQQQAKGWGAKIIEQLVGDLRSEFPDLKGLSSRNLNYMRAFAEAYPFFGFVQQTVAETEVIDNQSDKIVQQAVAQLPWGHHIAILTKVKTLEERLFYISKCVENSWSREVLSAQIESKLINRIGAAHTNFQHTLPAPVSELARDVIKNPYVFDFIAMGEKMQERDLENALIAHLKKFMLELGKGFAYVGNQYNLNVEGDDYFLDLLFYNTHLHCYVVFELKIGDFKPEFAGKLNFYINTIDAQIKQDLDAPTIGILLCKTPNETVVKYALQNMSAPMGVAEYQLAESLPKQLKGEIPSIEELEAEIDREYEELKSPSQKRLDLLKEKISGLGKSEIQIAITDEIFDTLLKSSIIPMFKQLLIDLQEYEAMFMHKTCYWNGLTMNVETPEGLDGIWNSKAFRESNKELTFNYRLWGFKKGGNDTFGIGFDLCFMIEPYWYGLVLVNHNNHQPFIKKLYPQTLSKEDLNIVNETIANQLLDAIEWNVERLKNEDK